MSPFTWHKGYRCKEMGKGKRVRDSRQKTERDFPVLMKSYKRLLGQGMEWGSSCQVLKNWKKPDCVE